MMLMCTFEHSSGLDILDSPDIFFSRCPQNFVPFGIRTLLFSPAYSSGREDEDNMEHVSDIRNQMRNPYPHLVLCFSNEKVSCFPSEEN